MSDLERIDRRDFIRVLASAGACALLAGCDEEPAERPASGRPVSGRPGSGRTAFLYHPVFLEHDTGMAHPEKPQRLTSIVNQLKEDALWKKLMHVEPKPAAVDTVALVHDRAYIDLAAKEIKQGQRRLSTGDTTVSAKSWEAALVAAGAAVTACDLVAAGKCRNAFCAVRPPGHHARPRKGGMGFCVFNNLAIAVRRAQKKHGLRRALVVDWDVHHGNGTQDAFWSDGSVLSFHTQRRGIYPGTGLEDERGEGKGLGLTMNFPLPRGSGNEVFERLYAKELVPAAKRFRPEIIFVSAGYDSHKDDPLGDLALDESGFARLTAILTRLADDLCEGRLVVVLEGGYDLDATARSASGTVKQLLAASGAAASAGRS